MTETQLSAIINRFATDPNSKGTLLEVANAIERDALERALKAAERTALERALKADHNASTLTPFHMMQAIRALIEQADKERQ